MENKLYIAEEHVCHRAMVLHVNFSSAVTFAILSLSCKINLYKLDAFSTLMY